MIARPYQSRLVERAEKALKTHGNTLAVAATGAGKTIMLANLAGRIGGKQLVIQHRQELVDQNLTKFRRVNPKAKVGMFTADVKTWRGDTTFAMVQTLAGEKHLAKMPKIDLLICDEAHHCAAPTWKAIIAAVKDANPDALVAGFTATPERSDKKGLRGIFSNVCDTVTIRELVQLGFLVPPRGFVIDVQGTQSQLQAIQGQSDYFDQGEVERILNTVAINEEVVRNWRERAGDRRTVVFCSTVQHAQDVAAAFRAAGVRAECVHGNMADEERQSIIKRFDRGQLQVVTNVMVLTEGFDCLDMETEVLCPSGWKKYGEISTGDDVYGYDLATGKIEACEVQNVGKRPLGPQERMVEIKSQHVNIRVTEGHNLFIRKNRRGDFVKIKARDMVSLKSEYEIPLTGDVEFNGVDLTDDEIRILAWYLTDGYLTKAGRLEIYQSEKKHATRIGELITRLGYKYWSFVRNEASNGFKQAAPIVTYCIGKRQLGNIYHLLTKNLHENIMQMDSRQFRLFWEELLLGDGSAQNNKAGWLWSNRIEVVNKIMQMAVTRGFSSSYATQEETTARKEVYRVSVREKRTIRSLPGDKRSATPRFCETSPGEEVWCVTNRLGTIITRRAGKVAVIGNCQPVGCVVLLRKCSAKGPLIQMVGRGLRTVNPEEYPGVRKSDCIVLDFGTSLLTHGDLEAGNALGDDTEREPGEAITKICPEKQSQTENYLVPDSNGAFGCGAELPAQTKTCPLCGFQFERPGGDDAGVTRVSLTEMDILNASPFRYVDLFQSGRAMIATGFEAWAGVFSADGENWSALGKVKNERRVHLLAETGRVMAMAAADDFLREHETDGSAKKTKGWLDQPATGKQIELLNRFGYQAQVDLLGQSEWTKYAAACHAEFQFNRRMIETALGVRQ